MKVSPTEAVFSHNASRCLIGNSAGLDRDSPFDSNLRILLALLYCKAATSIYRHMVPTSCLPRNNYPPVIEPDWGGILLALYCNTAQFPPSGASESRLALEEIQLRPPYRHVCSLQFADCKVDNVAETL